MNTIVCTKLLITAVSLASVLSAVACTARIDPGSSTQADSVKSKSDAGAPKAPPATTAVPPPATTAPPPGSSESCAKEDSQQSCIQCCDEQTGGDALPQYLDRVANCTCESEGPCATECASSLCKLPTAIPSAACNACLDAKDDVKRCVAAATESCNGNAKCVATLACIKSSGCEGQP